MAAPKPIPPEVGAKLAIVYRDPKMLQAYAQNSRTHSDQQILNIQASITEFGFTNPILLKDDGVTIGAGHARCRAALALGLDAVPTITLTGLTETQWRAYVIADNQIAINGAGWDSDILRAELDSLIDAGYDIGLTGFGLDDLTALAGVIEIPVELDQLASPNSVESKTLQMTFGKKKVPLTEGEYAILAAKLEAHINAFGMTSGFIEQLFNV